MTTTLAPVADFKKVVRPCNAPLTGGVRNGLNMGEVFCKIEWKDGKLSISGVHAPTSGGNCRGGAGQINMEFAHANPKHDDTRTTRLIKPDELDFAEGWTAETWLRFLDVWHEWHLNNLTPGCAHQRANWDTQEKIEVVEYHLTSEARRIRENAEKRAIKDALAGEVAGLTTTERALLALDSAYGTYYQPPDADSPLSGCMEAGKRKTEAAGWVTQKYHPKGLLSKPCEVCGYEYGSAWLKREVPADVLDFLRGLPNADRKPAWV